MNRKYIKDVIIVSILSILPAMYTVGYLKAHSNQVNGYSLINHMDDISHLNFIEKIGYKSYVKAKYNL